MAAAGDTLRGEVSVDHFTIVDPTTYPPVADGEGHFHVYFGEVLLGAVWETSFDVETSPDSELGPLELTLRLVDSAHADIVPLAEATATTLIE